MVYFEGNLLIDQVQGNHNMLEQLVNNYAGMILFFASIVGVLIVYNNFRGSKNLVTGINPLPHESLHYLQMIGGPVALFLLYMGLREYTATKDIKPLTG